MWLSIQETNTTRFSSKIVNEDYFVYHLGFRTLKGLVPEDPWKKCRKVSSCVFFCLSHIPSALRARCPADWWGLVGWIENTSPGCSWSSDLNGFITLDLKMKKWFKSIRLQERTCFHFFRSSVIKHDKTTQANRKTPSMAWVFMLLCFFSLVDTTPPWPKGHYGSQGDNPAKGS